MADTIGRLVRDTLQLLKDPLQTKQLVLASAEEVVFFYKKEKSVEIQVAPSAPKEQKPLSLPPDPQPQSPIKQMLQKAAPGVKIMEQVPDDSEAKRVAESWREKVSDAEAVLLLCDTDAETVDFLKGLAKAVDQHLAKTKIIAAERLEREKRWDIFLKNSFRFIIATEGSQKLSELMRFYKQSDGQMYLDKTPLLILSSASVYKSLEHKAQLWKRLCQM
jgi:hypothetical protein